MRNKSFYSFVTIFLTATLLFNQVGLNFFHDQHDVHTSIAGSNKDAAKLLKHEKHCRLCSTEVLFNLFIDGQVLFSFETQENSFIAFYKIEEPLTSISFSKGRAPPSILS